MDNKNNILWELAKQRAKFKSNLISYMLVNTFLWGVWFLSSRSQHNHSSFPWPLWVMLSWGIGLAIHYVNAYMSFAPMDIEKEYQKLKNKQSINN